MGRSRGRGRSGRAREQPVIKSYTKTDSAVKIQSETTTALGLYHPIPSFIFLFLDLKKESVFLCSLMQSDIENSDGIKSDMIIRWDKLSDFCPDSDDSANRIIKSKKGTDL